MKNRPVVFYFFMVIATLGWGISWPIGKILVMIAPPLTIGFFRFLIAFCCFLPVIFWKYSPRKYLSRSSLRDFLLLGLTGAFGYGIFFLIGLRFTTAAQGAIIAGINPAIVSLLAHFFFQEKLKQRWQYVGFGISFLGIIFVIGIQSLLDFQIEYLIGNLLILGAMGCWGLYTSISKKTMKENHSAFETTAGGVFMGMILFGIGSIFEEFWLLPGLSSMTFWIGVLVLGVFATFMSFTLYFVSVDSIGPTRAAIFINFVPIFGTLFSVVLLQEKILWTFVIGLVLVVVGIFIINFPNNED